MGAKKLGTTTMEEVGGRSWGQPQSGAVSPPAKIECPPMSSWARQPLALWLSPCVGSGNDRVAIYIESQSLGLRSFVACWGSGRA